MARYTSAYKAFVLHIEEVELLRRLAAEKEKEDPIKNRHEINALCRGAIVLLTSHLEAFIEELGDVTLSKIHSKSVSRKKLSSQFYYHLSKDLITEIKDTSQQEKIVEKVFSFLARDFAYWSRKGPFPNALPAQRFNKGFSTPSFDNIRSYLNRFGYSDYKKDIAHALTSECSATINMVDHLVDTRNKIAHGDINVTKTPSDVSDIMDFIKKYCCVTDSAFASWCAKNLCTIR
jgi:hypothetical protein